MLVLGKRGKRSTQTRLTWRLNTEQQELTTTDADALTADLCASMYALASSPSPSHSLTL